MIAHCCTHAFSNKQNNAIPMDLDRTGVRTMQASENICTSLKHFIFISFGQLYNKKHDLLINKDFQIWIVFRYLITSFGKENINISHLFLVVRFGKSIFFIFLQSFCEALVLKMGEVPSPIYLFSRKLSAEMDRTELQCFLLRLTLVRQDKCSSIW